MRAFYSDNPGLWRGRAEQARAIAEEMGDADSRRIMLSIAQGYEDMADRAEKRLARAQPPPS